MERSFYRRTFDTKDAMFDKLSFSIKGGHYVQFGTGRDGLENKKKFTKHLGAYNPKAHGSNLDLNTIKQMTGWIFTASSKKGRVPVRQLSVKRLPNDKEVSKPHFSGAYTMQRLPNSPDDEGMPDHLINHHMDVNPTRYLRDHIRSMRNKRIRGSYGRNLENGRNATNWKGQSMLTRKSKESQPDEGTERSLDGNDNWIPFHYQERENLPPFVPLKREKLLPKEEQINLAETTYLPLIDEALTDEFERAAEAAGLEYRKTSSEYVLSYAEVYWDIYHKNPVKAVKELKELLKGYSCYKYNIKPYEIRPADEPEEGGKLNSIRISLVLAAGVKLVIYAKTTQKIRFEIRYSFGTSDETEDGKDRRTVNAAHVFPTNRYTVPSICSLPNKINRLKIDASERLNQILGYIRERDTFIEPSDSFPISKFVNDFYTTVKDASLAKDILNLLVEEQHIVSAKPFTDALSKLEKAGVLAGHQHGGRNKVYRIAAPYYKALRLYAGNEMTPIKSRNTP